MISRGSTYPGSALAFFLFWMSACAPGVIDFEAYKESFSPQISSAQFESSTHSDNAQIQFSSPLTSEVCLSSSNLPSSCVVWFPYSGGKSIFTFQLAKPVAPLTEQTTALYVHQRNASSAFSPSLLGPYFFKRLHPSPLTEPNETIFDDNFCPTTSTDWDDFTVTKMGSDQYIVIGGRHNSGGNDVGTSKIWLVERDPDGVRRTFVSNMGVARYGHTATLIAANKILVTGGRPGYLGDAHATAELITVPMASGKVTTSGWSTSTPFTFFGATEKRRYHTAVALPNGKLVVSGGHRNGVGILGGLIYRVDDLLQTPIPALTPVPDAEFNVATTKRTKHRAIALPGTNQVLFVGGVDETNIELYAWFKLRLIDYGSDTPSLIWGNDGTIEYPRGDRLIAQLLPNGKILVAGGQSGGASILSSVLVDPAAQTIDFRAARAMSLARKNAAWTLYESVGGPTYVLIHGGHKQVTGGAAEGDQKSFEMYDADLDRFLGHSSGQSVGFANSSEGRDGHQLLTFSDGSVVALGCKGSGTPAPEFALELFPAP
jgi:hypothetical protein